MNNKFKLQLPIDLDLKDRVEAISQEEGFDSIQSFTRFLFTKIVNKEIYISVGATPDEIISKETEKKLNAIYEQALIDLSNGELPVFTNGKDLVNYIVSDKKSRYNKTISKASKTKDSGKQKSSKTSRGKN